MSWLFRNIHQVMTSSSFEDKYRNQNPAIHIQRYSKEANVFNTMWQTIYKPCQFFLDAENHSRPPPYSNSSWQLGPHFSLLDKPHPWLGKLLSTLSEITVSFSHKFLSLVQPFYFDILKKNSRTKKLKTQEKNSITQGKNSRSRQFFAE